MNDENNTVTAAEQPAVAEGADTPAPVAEETTEGDVQAENPAPEHATSESEPEQQAPATAAE